MRKHIRRFLPDHEAIRRNRWLAPFAGTLLHHRLWHLNRHSAAGAVAVGLFCGLIPGPLQMPSAAVACLIFRVNLPLALAATFFTNPLTIIPLYLAAFGIGQFVLGDGHVAFTQPPAFALTFDYHDIISWAHAVWDWAYDLGKPLIIGLVLLASALAMIGYFGVKLVWRWYLIRAWRRRSAKR